MAAVVDKRPILIPGVPEAEIRRLDEVARVLGTSRAGLIRRLVSELVAAAPVAGRADGRV
jgi:hypothetical protein